MSTPNYGYNTPETNYGQQPYPQQQYPQQYPQQQYHQASYAYPTQIRDEENGEQTSNASSPEWGDMSNVFSDKAIRIGFIRKVYFTLSTQLIFTFGVALVFVLVDPIRTFAKSETGFILYLVSYFIFLFLLIFSMCISKKLRKVPWNYVFLIAITLSMTYMLSMVSAYHDIQAVAIAAGITLLISVGVTIFAMQTKFDFTKNCMLVAICLCFALIGFGIACIFVRNNIMQAVYGGLGACVMALFLAIDTQLILGNKRFSFNPEDYITATLHLYLDICQLFLYILTIIGSKK